MERLADYTENREEMRSRTLGAMLYPVMLFFVYIVIVFRAQHSGSDDTAAVLACLASQRAMAVRLWVPDSCDPSAGMVATATANGLPLMVMIPIWRSR